MKVRTEERTVAIDEACHTTIHYLLERKKVKNLNLRIRRDGSVYLSASPRISPEETDRFVMEKADFILSAIKEFEDMKKYQPQPKQYASGESFTVLGHDLRLRVIQGEKNEIHSDGVFLYLQAKDTENFALKERIVKNYLNQQCREIFEEITDEIYPSFEKYGVERPVLHIRNMKTRWGSCMCNKGTVTLNSRLLAAPRTCVEYVVMHEMCHFIHANHSRQFYEFLTMMMPDWKDRRDVLNRCFVSP